MKVQIEVEILMSQPAITKQSRSLEIGFPRLGLEPES